MVVDNNSIPLKKAIETQDTGLTLREKFLKSYANVPIAFRNTIIAVIDSKPVSWDAAYIEIKADTPIGKEILEKLKKTGIL